MTGREGGTGIGFMGLLTIMLIGLKITGHIKWSWWLVTAPIWLIPVTVIVIIIIVAGMLAAFSADDKKDGRA